MNPRHLPLTLAIGTSEPVTVDLTVTFCILQGAVRLDMVKVKNEPFDEMPDWLLKLIEASPAIAAMIERDCDAIRAESGLTMDRAA